MHKSLINAISNSRHHLHRSLCPNLPSHLRFLSISQPAVSPSPRHFHLKAKMAMPRPISTIATSEVENGADDDTRYRPFLLDEETRSSDWISALELDTVTEMAQKDLQATNQPLRVLVLYGSLRQRYALLFPSMGKNRLLLLQHCTTIIITIWYLLMFSTTDHTQSSWPSKPPASCIASGATFASSTPPTYPSRTTRTKSTRKSKNCERSASGATDTSGARPSSTEL